MRLLAKYLTQQAAICKDSPVHEIYMTYQSCFRLLYPLNRMPKEIVSDRLISSYVEIYSRLLIEEMETLFKKSD